MRPELSRPLAIEHIGPRGLVQRLEATASECGAVAARLMIPAVLSLTCDFMLRRPAQGRGRIEAEGVLRARVAQDCVVSLDRFETDLAERFEVVFVPPAEQTGEDADDPQLPDELVYEGPAIDLGEAAVEQLALALDPYPRKPDATLPEGDADEAAGHPFAALARLQSKH